VTGTEAGELLECISLFTMAITVYGGGIDGHTFALRPAMGIVAEVVGCTEEDIEKVLKG
jgi:ribosomal protein S9